MNKEDHDVCVGIVLGSVIGSLMWMGLITIWLVLH